MCVPPCSLAVAQTSFHKDKSRASTFILTRLFLLTDIVAQSLCHFLSEKLKRIQECHLTLMITRRYATKWKGPLSWTSHTK